MNKDKPQPLILCKECTLYKTTGCHAVGSLKGVTLTPNSGCTFGELKKDN